MPSGELYVDVDLESFVFCTTTQTGDPLRERTYDVTDPATGKHRVARARPPRIVVLVGSVLGVLKLVPMQKRHPGKRLPLWESTHECQPRPLHGSILGG
jgi:hypothetical protein